MDRARLQSRVHGYVARDDVDGVGTCHDAGVDFMQKRLAPVRSRGRRTQWQECNCFEVAIVSDSVDALRVLLTRCPLPSDVLMGLVHLAVRLDKPAPLRVIKSSFDAQGATNGAQFADLVVQLAIKANSVAVVHSVLRDVSLPTGELIIVWVTHLRSVAMFELFVSGAEPPAASEFARRDTSGRTALEIAVMKTSVPHIRALFPWSMRQPLCLARALLRCDPAGDIQATISFLDGRFRQDDAAPDVSFRLMLVTIAIACNREVILRTMGRMFPLAWFVDQVHAFTPLEFTAARMGAFPAMFSVFHSLGMSPLHTVRRVANRDLTPLALMLAHTTGIPALVDAMVELIHTSVVLHGQWQRLSSNKLWLLFRNASSNPWSVGFAEAMLDTLSRPGVNSMLQRRLTDVALLDFLEHTKMNDAIGALHDAIGTAAMKRLLSKNVCEVALLPECQLRSIIRRGLLTNTTPVVAACIERGMSTLLVALLENGSCDRDILTPPRMMRLAIMAMNDVGPFEQIRACVRAILTSTGVPINAALQMVRPGLTDTEFAGICIMSGAPDECVRAALQRGLPLRYHANAARWINDGQAQVDCLICCQPMAAQEQRVVTVPCMHSNVCQQCLKTGGANQAPRESCMICRRPVWLVARAHCVLALLQPPHVTNGRHTHDGSCNGQKV